MGGIFLKAMAGGLAGLLAWLMWEPRFPKDYVASDPRWGPIELMFVLTMGALIGLTLGGLGGWMKGSRLHAVRGLLIGAVLGMLGAWIGYRFGGVLSMLVGGTNSGSVLGIFARVLALTPIGTLLGLAIGASGLTWRRAMVGAIGGTIGGAIAGFLFDPVSSIVAGIILDTRGGTQQTIDGIPVVSGEVGIVGRAIFALATGLFTGLFIGIVERVVRTAWVRQVLGRNEGKEFVLDAAQNFLGRDERAQVPLFGDPHVAPMHACIVRQGEAYVLMDGGSPIGTGVNGQRVQQAALVDGTHIQIGSHNLVFMLKAGAAHRAAEAARYHPFNAAPTAAPAAAGYVPGPTQAMPPQPVSAPTMVQAPARTYTLVAVDGPLVGQRFPVSGPVEIGREGAQIRLGFDPSASRRHATAVPTADGVQVTDLASTNGTFVNNVRVPAGTARAGETIRIGSTTFRVE